MINLKKGGKRAFCDPSQLAAMKKQGWTVVPPSRVTVAEDEPMQVDRPYGAIPLFKDGVEGFADQKTLQAMLKAGWQQGEPPEPDEALADVLAALDPDDGELWNKDGSLKMGAFNERFEAKETKATIQNTWPGFSRDALIDHAAGR